MSHDVRHLQCGHKVLQSPKMCDCTEPHFTRNTQICRSNDFFLGKIDLKEFHQFEILHAQIKEDFLVRFMMLRCFASLPIFSLSFFVPMLPLCSDVLHLLHRLTERSLNLGDSL